MIEIKRFTFDNSELMKIAHQIRHVVFVIGQNCPEEIEWEYEEESTHFLVLDNGRSVATARHRKTKNGFKLERFAVVESERKKGYGKIVLKAILEDLSDFNGKIYMHAQKQVLPFYEKSGFKKEGKEFEEAGIMHFKMYLKK
ncbi:MAG TPA: GNAT family N-acetyltransferase [Flavobacteriales bacterium]|jgi:predicted GNAT family N-acyltransferase|nr:GNAT family N-acetyltransferase [Flavobacteriales bacterium]|tara:strand:- start:1727 stop:2152 length:426 start_codon:yes stop_codon:yes gene_type:complete